MDRKYVYAYEKEIGWVDNNQGNILLTFCKIDRIRSVSWAATMKPHFGISVVDRSYHAVFMAIYQGIDKEDRLIAFCFFKKQDAIAFRKTLIRICEITPWERKNQAPESLDLGWVDLIEKLSNPVQVSDQLTVEFY